MSLNSNFIVFIKYFTNNFSLDEFSFIYSLNNLINTTLSILTILFIFISISVNYDVIIFDFLTKNFTIFSISRIKKYNAFGWSNSTDCPTSITYTSSLCYNKFYSDKSAWTKLHSFYKFFIIIITVKNSSSQLESFWSSFSSN